MPSQLFLYFVGYFISMSGTAATQTADGWVAFSFTGSESFLGANALLLQGPYVVLSLLVGGQIKF